MSVQDQDVRQLADAVRKAFWHVVYPGDEKLLAEDCADTEELAKLQKQDWNSHWTNVPNEMVEWCSNSLAFLSPAAFRFYLPAFIAYSLEEPDSDQAVLPFLVYELRNTAEGAAAVHGSRAVYVCRMELLSKEQKTVVLRFLEYVRDVLHDPMCLREATIAVDYFRVSLAGKS